MSPTSNLPHVTLSWGAHHWPQYPNWPLNVVLLHCCSRSPSSKLPRFSPRVMKRVAAGRHETPSFVHNPKLARHNNISPSFRNTGVFTLVSRHTIDQNGENGPKMSSSCIMVLLLHLVDPVNFLHVMQRLPAYTKNLRLCGNSPFATQNTCCTSKQHRMLLTLHAQGRKRQRELPSLLLYKGCMYW